MVLNPVVTRKLFLSHVFLKIINRSNIRFFVRYLIRFLARFSNSFLTTAMNKFSFLLYFGHEPAFTHRNYDNTYLENVVKSNFSPDFLLDFLTNFCWDFLPEFLPDFSPYLKPLLTSVTKSELPSFFIILSTMACAE